MASRMRCLRLAILNADTSIPNTYADKGTFGDLMVNVLNTAASHTQADLSIKYEVYNVVDREYPESLCGIDAVIVTASAASSYDIKPWILALQDYLVELYEKHSSIKLFGSCFGHHMICQALLKDYGLRVEKNINGWEIGINRVILTDDFQKAFGKCLGSQRSSSTMSCFGRPPTPDEHVEGDEEYQLTNLEAFAVPTSVRLQFVHEDQVAMPSLSKFLPPPWILLGSTEKCALQGVYQPGRVLTLQGHFEFDKFQTQDTNTIFGACGTSAVDLKTDEMHNLGEDGEEAQDDGYLVAEMVIWFLCHPGQKSNSPNAKNEENMEMLITPRASVGML